MSPGTFTINDEAYTVDNEVTFTVKDSVLESVSGLDGNISGNFENGITVNREDHVVQILSDEVFTVAATGKKVEEISVSGDEVTVISAGGATHLSTDSDGEFTFGKKTFTVSDDSDGIIFALDKTANVTGVKSRAGRNDSSRRRKTHAERR